MHVDEVDINPELIKALLLEQFPEFTNHPLQKMHPEGTDNVLYRLGNDKLIRLPRTKSSSLNIEKELTWLPRLGPKLPISIPKILCKGLSNKNYPFPWLICEWLDGINPDQEDMVGKLKVAADLATFVNAMQQIPAKSGPNCRRGQPLNTCDKQVLQSIPLLNKLYDTSLLKKLWESAINVPHWKKEPVWIHGDLHAGNLIVKDRILVGIVDWGLAGVGDPACDMMVAWTLLNQQSRKIFHSIIQPDDDSWARGRGWALFLGIVGYPYYRNKNPIFARIAKRALDQVIADN